MNFVFESLCDRAMSFELLCIYSTDRMRRARLPCPSPLALKKNVLVMTCIGGETPAPKLKDVTLSAADAQIAYEQVVEVRPLIYDR